MQISFRCLTQFYLCNKTCNLLFNQKNFRPNLSLGLGLSFPLPKMSVASSHQQPNSLSPPSEVQGMTVLNREAFKKEIDVPYLLVPIDKIKEAVKVLKPCFLKMPNLQPVEIDTNNRKVLLHPHLFDENLPYLQKIVAKLGLNSVVWTKIELTYDNWTPDNIFKAVLPPDTTGNVSSFSIVGHIIHVNLKENLIPYKNLIGQVLLDKHRNIKTVVNKAQVIENEFRNLSLELLAGEANYDVLVKENNCQYKFDFSKVFWNPRLVNEHNEIVKRASSGDLVFDVFAGVGPFAVPLAKKKCQVHANDLNPDSYHWLCHNADLNKVSKYIHPHNLDGRDFIQTVVKKGLVDIWNNNEECSRVHVLMNLPACALDFLDAFNGLLVGEDLKSTGVLPTIYCYFFKKKDEETSEIMDKYFDSETQKTLELTTVRLVAPNKYMMRVAYKIPKSILCSQKDLAEPSPKRFKTDCDDNSQVQIS